CAQDRQTMFQELEIEIGNGTPDSVVTPLHRLGGVTPLRLGVLSKAERGYRLLGPALGSYKAEPVVLDPGMTAHQALPVLAAACLRQYRLNEAVLLDRHEPEAVHQARVALRRLRSLFAIFDALLDTRAREAGEAVRTVARALGAVRDLDVMMARDDLAQHRDALRQRAAADYRALVTTLEAAQTRRLFLDLAAWLADVARSAPGPVGDRPITAFAADALERARRRLARRARHFTRLSPAKRHRARVSAKRLNYADDFFAPLFAASGHPRRLRRFSRALRRLQDRLGDLNDVAVARAAAAKLGATGPVGDEEKLLRRANHTLHEVLDARPYWRAA
ncbi:MAG: CHAD domain-containing protein, partial [Sphingomonas sp.]